MSSAQQNTGLGTENKKRWTSLHRESSCQETRLEPSLAIRKILSNKEAIKSVSAEMATLEVGCGFGRNLHFLMENGFSDVYYGIDQTEVAVRSSSELMADGIEAQRCFLTEMDAARGIRFQNETFDCIFDIMSAITFIPESEGRLSYWRDIHRLLRPGGVYMFLTVRTEGRIHDKTGDSQELGDGLFRRRFDRMIEKSYSQQEIMELTAGLEKVELSVVSEHIRAFGDKYFEREEGFWFGVFRKPL